MLSWPALLVAPLIALSQLSIAYSLVTPACARQDRSTLHAVAVVSLLLVVLMTLMAWRAWSQRRVTARERDATAPDAGRPVTLADSDSAAERPHFIEMIAVLAGGLSMLVCIALWVPIWFLSPCY